MSVSRPAQHRSEEESRVTHRRRRGVARPDEWRARHPRARRDRQRLRKLLFGDWHPLLRDPLDLMRLTFAVAAVLFLFAGNLNYAVRFFIGFLALVGAQRLRVPRLFDLLFILGVALSLWGSYFHLFETANYCFPHIKLGKVNHFCVGYDKLVHTVLPLSSVPVLYILFLRLGLLPDLAEQTNRRMRLGLVLFAVMAVVSVVTIYEIYEYVAVYWFYSTTIVISFSDTTMDLVLGVVAGLLGGVLLWTWAVRHWPTERGPLFP
jgi:hypothetical protein